MPTEVIMPKVDMDMSHGTVSAWLVTEGATVEKGAPLFEIETDKAAMEVESPASGTVLHVSAPPGTEVAIGTAVAWIYAEGENTSIPPPTNAPDEVAGAALGTDPQNSAASPAQSALQSSQPAPATGLRSTPRARRDARAAGVDLATLSGSGPLGRIQASDVVNARAAAHPSTAPTTWQPGSGPLSVIRTGDGDKTPFLLIHGLAGDAASWAMLEPLLPPGHPILKLELPSHGHSPLRRITSFADLLADVRAAFDDLGLERVHLVGHSLGGAVALGLADTRARRISRLTLIAPAGLGAEVNGPAIRGLVTATRKESLAPWLKTLVHDPALISDSFAAFAMSQRQSRALRAAQADLGDAVLPDGVQAFDLTAALARIEMPTRLIWGRSDAILPWKQALRAPGRVSLNLFDATGHLPHVERAQEVAMLLQPE